MEALPQAITHLLRGAPQSGLAMGAIVDRLLEDGWEREPIEHALWEMLQARRLTPVGYVRRTMRRRGPSGQTRTFSAYEFMLVAWSPEQDHQLDPGLAGDEP